MLERQLQAMTSGYRGNVGLYATDLRSGRTVSLHADDPVPTASVIKLAVLWEAVQRIRAGTVAFDDIVQMRKGDQVQGSGVLLFFDTPLALTFKDVLTMMVVQSDNTATNLAIDHLGLANIDARIVSLGLHNTWLYKKVFLPPAGPVPPDQPTYGLGKTTPREMASLISQFLACSDDPCRITLQMLKNQMDRDGIPRYLDSRLDVANKTGALDQVRNDVGIVFAPNGPVIISAFTHDNADQRWTADNSAQLLIARLAKAIVDRWQ